MLAEPTAKPLALAVMTYNVHSCINVYGRENPAAIARTIAMLSPDVVALQEVETMGPLMRYRNQAEWIAEKVGMQAFFYPLRKSRWGKFGSAILSRYPGYMVKTGLLPVAGIMNNIREPRGAIWIRVQTPHGPLHVINTHLGLRMQDRHYQIRRLLGRNWLGGISKHEPIVFCGDFNAGARSLVYRLISARYADVQLATGQRGYPKPTFFSLYPMMRLDHIFVSRHLNTQEVKVPLDFASRRASDHLPVCARLILNAAPGDER